jgi:carboxymethylenebutenolidase
MKTNLEHNQRYLVEEFAEAYLEHRMARRDLLRRVLLLTGSVPLTASVLLALGCGDSDDEPAATPTASTPPLATTEAGAGPGVAPTDPAIQAQDIRFPGPASELIGYIARPSASGAFPAILVIPENQGLLEHFKDVARRYAKEGFVALSLDVLSRQGGTSTDMAAVMAAYRTLTTEGVVADMKGSLDYLKSQSFVRGNALGATGFCLGGNYVWEIVLASPEIKAAAPYYGTVDMAKLGQLRQVQAAVLAVYGGLDTRVTAQSALVDEQLKASGKPYEIKIYPTAGHGFFNEGRANTGNFGYDPVASAEAWKNTLAWFRRHLTA